MAKVKKAAKTSAKKTPAQNRAVKKPVPAKKSVATAKPVRGNTPPVPTAKPVAEKKPRAVRKPKITVQPWHIMQAFVDGMVIFGIASDQRIYRWNTRSALWVLHKEGLSATQA